MATWTKPNGDEIEVNDHPGNAAAALQAGWELIDDVDPDDVDPDDVDPDDVDPDEDDEDDEDDINLVGEVGSKDFGVPVGTSLTKEEFSNDNG